MKRSCTPDAAPRFPWWPTVRTILNWINGSTIAGRILARRAGCTLTKGARGVLVAGDYPRGKFPAPHADAVTVGDVVLCRLPADHLLSKPKLFAHEASHCDQWALCGGIIGFFPLYLIAASWSALRTGCFGRFNMFEQWAGLLDGGYDPKIPKLPTGSTWRSFRNAIGGKKKAGSADSGSADSGSSDAASHDHHDGHDHGPADCEATPRR